MATLAQIAQQLLHSDDIAILTHRSPDGDTLGSGYALYHGLTQLGKRATVLCADPLVDKFDNFIVEIPAITPTCWVSVDVADPALLGGLAHLGDQVSICIDHHRTNKFDAPYQYVDHTASATCEIIYDLLGLMEVTITPVIANALYTGICTDTGCFQFSNTSPKTHRIAACLMEAGAEAELINRLNFGIKTRGRLTVEMQVVEQMDYAFDNQVAIAVLTQKMMNEIDVTQEELGGIATLVRQIEGVEVGVLLKEQPDGSFKISMRSAAIVDVAKVCSTFGGGGHKRAAGGLITDDLPRAKTQITQALAPYFS